MSDETNSDFNSKQENKYIEFTKYDWGNCEKWKLHLTNLHPTPTREQVLRIRKKFYKRNVDDEFNPNYLPVHERRENNQDEDQDENFSNSKPENEKPNKSPTTSQETKKNLYNSMHQHFKPESKEIIDNLVAPIEAMF